MTRTHTTVVMVIATALIACNPTPGATLPQTPVDTSFPLVDDEGTRPDATTADAGDDDAPEDGPSDAGGELAPDAPTDAESDAQSEVDSSTDTSACPTGQPCDDGNNCTINDQCIAGTCEGTPLPCSDDDGLPCTSGACQDGACVTVIAAGFCAISGACWTTGQPNPAGGCQACDPSKNATTWSGDGSTCDDGDPCTHTDTCAPGGGCAGTPIVCPASQNPCVTSQCVAGVCESAPIALGASCNDGDACTMNESCSAGTCTNGVPKDSDGDGAVDVACGGLDCNDGTNALGPNVAEVCTDQLDNDCDGDTDGADSDCELVAPDACTHHSDCYPEGVCARWPGALVNFCSTSCAGAADCEPGYLCSKVPGSANVGFCHVEVPGTTPTGASCNSGAECASQVCIDSVCSAVCFNGTHCPGAGNTCGLIGDVPSGTLAGLCLPNGSYFPNGQQCLLGGNENPGVCASGHCDLMNVPGPYNCAPLCKTQGDCALDQQCDLVLYMDTPNAEAVSYHPIVDTAGTAGQKAPRDSAMACFSRVNPGGTIADGTPCANNDQCLGGRCLALLPGDNTQYCTRFCALDNDCGAGMGCKLEMVTIVSDFLQNFDTLKPDYWTYARICKFD